MLQQIRKDAPQLAEIVSNTGPVELTRPEVGFNQRSSFDIPLDEGFPEGIYLATKLETR
jgi:hypothetical protein